MHHFIIGLNEKEGSLVVRDGGFLSEYERKDLDDGERITEGLISSYLAFNENVYISCSSNTSDGAALPLTGLAEYAVKGELSQRDSWLIESSPNRYGKMFGLQKEGYENAVRTSLRKLEDDDRSVAVNTNKPVLSFSNVSDYEKCPFYYSLI